MLVHMYRLKPTKVIVTQYSNQNLPYPLFYLNESKWPRKIR